MSTQTQEPSTTDDIPDQVKHESRGMKSWRFANGQICRGSKDSGTLEVWNTDNKEVTECEIIGKLLRCSVEDYLYSRENEPDERVYVLEFELQTKEGPQRLSANLLDMEGNEKPSAAAISIAWGLLQCAKGELLSITSRRSSEKNKFKSYSTWINFNRVVDGRAKEVPRRPKGSDDMEADLAKLIVELKGDDAVRAHPAYAPRPFRPKAGSSLERLCCTCDERGWANPIEAQAEWLVAANKSLKKSPTATSVRGFSEAEWDAIDKQIDSQDKLPAFLVDVTAKLGKVAGAAKPVADDDEHDPFA